MRDKTLPRKTNKRDSGVPEPLLHPPRPPAPNNPALHVFRAHRLELRAGRARPLIKARGEKPSQAKGSGLDTLASSRARRENLPRKTGGPRLGAGRLRDDPPTRRNKTAALPNMHQPLSASKNPDLGADRGPDFAPGIRVQNQDRLRKAESAV